MLLFHQNCVKFLFQKDFVNGWCSLWLQCRRSARRAVRCHRRCSAVHICSTLELSYVTHGKDFDVKGCTVPYGFKHGYEKKGGVKVETLVAELDGYVRQDRVQKLYCDENDFRLCRVTIELFLWFQHTNLATYLCVMV